MSEHDDQHHLPDEQEASLEQSGRVTDRLDISFSQALDLLESISAAFYSLDKEWRFVYLNEKAAQRWGKTREELIGKRIWDEFPQSATTQAYKEMHRALKEQHPVRFETFSTILDTWVEVEVNPTRTGLSVYFHDITQRKRAEAGLERLAAIVTSSNDAIISKTLDGMITSWNEGAERIFGYTAAEVMHKSITLIIPPDRLGEEKMFLEKIAAGEIIQNYDTVRLNKDGTEVFVWVSLSPLRDGFGNIIGATKIAQNITERKFAENSVRESEARLAGIIDSAMDAIITVDDDQRILLFNHAAEIMFRCASDQAVGESLERFIPIRYRAVHRDHIRGFGLTGITTRRMEALGGITGLRADGDEFPIEASISQIVTREQKYFTVILRDITERKRAEAEIHELNEHLEQLVEARTTQLQMVNQELDAFAYVVSHDLKAPVRGITQLASWLIADYSDHLDEEGLNMLKLMVGRSTRMHEMIEGILQYSRIGRVKENPTRIDLNQVVAGVVDLLMPPVNIEIVVAPDLPIVAGDEMRMRQVFQNLIGNAIKYMDKPSGKITVTCSDQQTHWQFAVADNGPGIAAQYHEKVFQLFQTLSPRDQVESTGIGLSLVKKIVELHDGHIWLDSGEGKGATFYFTLPKIIERKQL